MNSFLASVIVIISFKIQYFETVLNEFVKYDDGENDRLEMLKQLLRDEIKRSDDENLSEMELPSYKGQTFVDDYEVLMDDDTRITPIMDTDKLRLHKVERDKVTTSPTTMDYSEAFDVKPLRTNVRKKKKKSVLRQRKPAEIFYRRELDRTMNAPVAEIHCIDLLTSYLIGEKGNGTFKIIKTDDHIVLRLLHLIGIDTSKLTRDEIYSLLYQISSINIRLYQWEDEALSLLLNQIIKDTSQNFKTLKRGVKNLLGKWHMDYGNITNLLRQVRIFRPPCFQTSELEGSTRSSRGTRYTKSTTPKKICPASAEEC